METTNNLKHKISITEKVNCVISIRLNDECKNGHEDFSITSDFWKLESPRTDRNWIMGGCCHEEILKFRPDLKIFVDLHLNDFRGYPMYYIENGFYHLNNMPKDKFMEYAKVDETGYELLKKASDKDEYGYLLLNKLENHKIWENLAKEGVKIIEELTGKVFESKGTRLYDIDKYKTLNFPENWFDDERVEKRRKESLLYKINKKVSAMEKEHKRKIEEMQNEFSIKKSLMQLGFLDLNNTRHYFNEREFHINVKKKVLSSDYKIENSKSSYTFTEEDYEQMHIGLPVGYRLIFNSYE